MKEYNKYDFYMRTYRKDFISILRLFLNVTILHPAHFPIYIGNHIYLLVPPRWALQVLKQIKFSHCQVFISHHTVNLIDSQNRFVTRISFNSLGNLSIKINSEFLQLASHYVNVPSLLNKSYLGNYSFSVEAYINNKFSPSPIFISNNHLSKIIESISYLYNKTCIKKIFSLNFFFNSLNDKLNLLRNEYRKGHLILKKEIKRIISDYDGNSMVFSFIHGDLTYRNIIFKDSAHYFIDGDRYELLFPEIDVMLLILDLHVYQHDPFPRSYDIYMYKFVEICMNLDFENVLDLLYVKAPKFRKNKEYLRLFKAILLYRIVVLSLLNLLADQDVIIGISLINNALKITDSL